MYDYPYYYAQIYHLASVFTVLLPVMAFLLALAGGLALYFLFMRRPNDAYHGAAAKLHDILNFRVFFSESLLRLLYALAVAALAVYSLILLFINAPAAIALFLTGNVLLRLLFELLLLFVGLCRSHRPGTAPQPEQAPTAPKSPVAPQSPVAPRQEQPHDGQ